MRNENNLEPGKFRTETEIDKEQVCYYNYNKKDRAFNRFLAVRKQTSTDAIMFSIVNLIVKSNNHEDNYFKVGDELRKFNNVSIQPEQRIQRVSKIQPDRETNDRRQQQQQQQQQQRPDQNQNSGRSKSAKSPSFFQNNKDIKREKVGKQYTITHIKSRNFLSNVVGVNKEDFYNENFVFNVFSLITNKLNRFYLDSKLSNQNKHEMIYMLWECIPCAFYKHICSEQNFFYLNGKKVLCPIKYCVQL